MKWLVLVLLMVGFVSGLDVDFDCPDKIFAGEEFECSLEVFDGDGEYDVKVEVDKKRDSVLRIWDEEENKWLSGYYYLREFVEDGEEVDVRLKVLEVGRHDVVLKLRQGDDRKLFEVGEIIVRENSVDGELIVDDGSLEEVVVLGNVVDEIVLNDAVVYESRDWEVVNGLVYGFCVFLIFVILILLWERKN